MRFVTVLLVSIAWILHIAGMAHADGVGDSSGANDTLIIYVDAGASGDNSGSSWQDACQFLRDGLSKARLQGGPCEIRVAQGVYVPDRSADQPDGSGDANAVFELVDGSSLVGGYAGAGEASPDLRDTELYATVLSGDLAGDDSEPFENRQDNCLTVVHGAEGASIDGFVIRGGYYRPGDWRLAVGGMATEYDCSVANCTFEGNVGYSGGGFLIRDCSANLRDCRFVGNRALLRGGGLGCYNAEVSIVDCSIEGNSATRAADLTDGGNGGGIYCDAKSILRMDNCVVKGNAAGAGRATFDEWCHDGGKGGNGGGIYCSSASISGCVISENAAGDGGQSHEGGADNGGDGGSGGGIYSLKPAQLIVSDCRILDNMAGQGGDVSWSALCGGSGGNGGSGGGICCASPAGPVLIRDCTVAGNKTGRGGFGQGYSGGNGGDAGSGGGILCPSAELLNCEIMSNGTGDGGWGGGNSPARGGHGGSGGGLYGPGTSIIKNCVVAGNTTGGGGRGGNEHGGEGGDGGDGAGVFAPGGTVVNCTITDNIGGAGGEAVVMWGYETDGRAGAGAGVHADGDTTVTSSIVWDNSPDDLAGQDCNNVGYCCLTSGQCVETTGNIDSDPLFADPAGGDYHLQSVAGRWDAANRRWVTDDVSSACIDAGDPNDDSFVMELWPNGSRVNMGAYGGTAQASLSDSNEGSAGDFDSSGRVDFGDYAVAASQWGQWYGYAMPHGEVTVDGDLEEWADAVWVSADKIYHLSPNDVSEAGIAMCWDGERGKIYAAVVVRDGNHVFADSYESWDASDRIEVFSDGDISDGGGRYGAGTQTLYATAQQYMIGPNTTGGCWATWGNGQAVETEAELEYSVRVDGDLLIYEIGVKMFDYLDAAGQDTITTDLAERTIVGFDIAVDTRWGPKVAVSDHFGMLSENLMAGKHRDSANLARYALVGRLGGSSKDPLKADCDRDTIVGASDLAIFAEQWLREW